MTTPKWSTPIRKACLIPAHHYEIYIEGAIDYWKASKNMRRKAIRYGKELPKSIQESIQDKVSLAVRDYLSH